MRILVYSDLHLEFPAAARRFRVPEGLAYDAVILAGDIHQHTQAIEWAEQTFAGKLIIYAIGKCRVICNPRGYLDKLKDTVENQAFLDDFVVEV